MPFRPPAIVADAAVVDDLDKAATADAPDAADAVVSDLGRRQRIAR